MPVFFSKIYIVGKILLLQSPSDFTYVYLPYWVAESITLTNLVWFLSDITEQSAYDVGRIS